MQVFNLIRNEIEDQISLTKLVLVFKEKIEGLK